MNINDEKDLGLHPINIKTARPGQLSPLNGQLAVLREPPPPFSRRNSLTGQKKTSDVPYQCHQPWSSSMPPNVLILYVKLYKPKQEDAKYDLKAFLPTSAAFSMQISN